MKRHCSIDDCGNAVLARGYCRKHYNRWLNHGDPLFVKFARALNGVPQAFIDSLPASGDACLQWPFAKNNEGYAQINAGNGKKLLVSRVVCERQNGPPPSPDHQAAHSCGNGHLACVAPYHVSWKLPKDNQADRIKHGTTLAGIRSPLAKLTEDDVRAIRSLQGAFSQEVIGAKFGVCQKTVSLIHRRERWGSLT